MLIGNLLVVLILSFGASAAQAQTLPAPGSAQTQGGWKLIRESIEKVYTPNEFATLQTQNLDVLANIDPQSVTWAQVDVKRYGWVGATTCAAGDARLSITGKGFSYCLDRGGNSVTACTAASITPAMTPQDPCTL